MTSLLQALIRQFWSPHAMGAIQGERVGEQFGLRSNEAWVSEEQPIAPNSTPPFLVCFPKLDVFIIQHAPENKHKMWRAWGHLYSLLFSLLHC